MSTELEERLSERLHREAMEFVPGGAVPPLPITQRRWWKRLGSSQFPWRAPILAAGAVVVIALATTVVMQWNRSGGATPAVR